MVAAVTQGEYQFDTNILRTSASPFLCGMLLSSDFPENDLYARLDLMVTAATESRVLLARTALLHRVMTAMSDLPSFSNQFEESKWVLLLQKSLLNLTSFASLSSRLREMMVLKVTMGVKNVLGKVTTIGCIQELYHTLRDKCILLGEPALTRLSPFACQFLAGETVPDTVKIASEICEIGDHNSLLGVYFYLRLVTLATSSDSSDCLPCLKLASNMLSTDQIKRISSYLPSAKSPSIPDQFRSFYTSLRSKINENVYIQGDEIAAELSKIVTGDEGKQGVWETAISLMQGEEDGKQAALTWKLMLFGMHKLRMFTGKQWFDLNDTLNRKFGDGKKTWKKKEIVENRVEEKKETEKTGGKKGKKPKKVEETVNPEAKIDSIVKETVEKDKKEEVKEQKPVADEPYDPTANPWDLPDTLPKPRKSAKK